MRKSIMYVGMDQHKESIEIATAEEGRRGEVRRHGRIDGELDSLDREVRKLVFTGKECGMPPASRDLLNKSMRRKLNLPNVTLGCYLAALFKADPVVQ